MAKAGAEWIFCTFNNGVLNIPEEVSLMSEVAIPSALLNPTPGPTNGSRTIVKRDGRLVRYNPDRIHKAVKACLINSCGYDEDAANAHRDGRSPCLPQDADGRDRDG